MSRNAHEKSTYKLAEMPKCKCKGQLILTCSKYEGKKDIVEEWECIKCGKVYPLSQIQEPQFSGQDIWLANWCKKNNK